MKRIPLTKGKSVLVDDDVYEWASKYPWCALGKAPYLYAYHNRLGLLSRQIMRRKGLLFRGALVTYRNRNRLDCRLANLEAVHRPAVYRDHGPGVIRRGNSWLAVRTVARKRHYLGTYRTREAAIAAAKKPLR